MGSDWYLAESWAIKNGNYDIEDINNNGTLDWVEKGQKLSNYNIQVAAITTVNDPNYIFNQQKADYSYYAGLLFGFDAWGLGEVNYSALGGINSLIYRDRKFIPPFSTYLTNIIYNGNIMERKINVGIKIDTVNKSVSSTLS